MKNEKLILILTILFLIYFFSGKAIKEKVESVYYKSSTVTIKKDTKIKCDPTSPTCAIDTFISCSMDYERDYCDSKKMPNFIFMQDEMLRRPTAQSYRIVSTRKTEDGSTVIKTKCKSNGTLFGLCNGEVVYIIDKDNNLEDLYALVEE